MSLDEITVTIESPYTTDAINLMDELSKCLENITGDSGKNSFSIEDVCCDQSMFVIARNQNGEAIGCGAFRPIDIKTAEVKRMYSKIKALGVGTKILSFLECGAYNMVYTSIRIETRVVNKQAVSFYEHSGYHRIPNYGKYINNEKAVCFENFLSKE